MKLPDHYQPLMPYLVIKGADEFIGFLKQVFDAKEYGIYRNEDGSIMHAEIGINGGTLLIGDTGDKASSFPAPLYLPTDRVDELYQRGLDAGAEGNMPPEDKPYGRAAGFKDEWGNQWWLNAPAELTGNG